MNEKRSPLNWTSTHVPMWQIDCETYRKTERPFELRDVGDEHMGFVATFAKQFNLKFTKKGSTVVFEKERR
jgi:hypothetical protein